jgi:hypothetical protein
LEQELCRASDSQRLFVAADRLLQLPKLSVDIADLDQRRNFAFGIPDFPPDHQSLPVISEGLFEISEPIVGGAEVIQHTALACTISHFAPDDQRLLVTLDGRLELTGTEQDGADVVDIDGRSVAPVLSFDLKGRCVVCNRFLEGVFLFEIVPPRRNAGRPERSRDAFAIRDR